MRMRLKRWLYLVHRWMGVGLCAFLAMWFLSGMVMMYVGYPKLTESERLAHLPGLGDGAGLLGARQALDLAGVRGALKSLRLSSARAGQPVYLAMLAGTGGVPDRAFVIDARSGSPLGRADAKVAIASAAAFEGALADPARVQHLGAVQEDAFTHSRALRAHRPLHELRLADRDDTIVYVSSLTGEVVLDASATERHWNYVGAWIHWLYPFRGNVFDRHWSDIVIWLSLAGVVLCATGTVVGILRWRFARPYRSGSRSPYPGRMMRWHHISGLLFAGVTLTWIFSGLMSMNPWGVFDAGGPKPSRSALQQAQPLLPTADDAAPRELLGSGGDVRELRWVPVLGRLTVQAWGAAGRPRILDSRTGGPLTVDEQALRRAAASMMAADVLHIERQTAYDFYYYAREPHTMTGGNDRPLPVLRVDFADSNANRVYIDPHTGTVVTQSDRHERAGRWLFALMHSWDWLPLLSRRPAWDLVLLVASIGGVALSLTGIVIAWRRVGVKLGHKRKTARLRPQRH
ncbi:PepSY-associated TM helix domain-containing protein [Variovorax dokdonensis]|uniref:PepSY-associated TM helix domain-containing protein n=1 Tax=Variovorax dokdonensis TaxID=344883 RepID=A0ABT7N4S6_9BURK|nr:PepSY-associated TM helix domain-containing protein [Variovorax dokdonensis]MDM0042908.1 PepSY-associated TM helix domain-containing protein [Variovorax dokdonensis]